MRHAPARWKLLVAFAAVYLIWGSTFLAIRIAVRTFPPFLLGGFRFLSAGALLYAWASVRREPGATPLQWRAALVTGTLLIFCLNSSVLVAAPHMNSGMVALFLGMIPLWMAALQALGLGGRKPTALTWLGMALGVAGIVVLARPTAGGVSQPLLVLALAGGCFSWALGSLLSARLGPTRSSMRAAGMPMMVGGAGLLIVGFFTGEFARFHPATIAPEAFAALAYLALFGSVVAFSAYVWLLRVCPPTRVATYAFVNPVVAVILGAMFGAERLDARVALAGGLIVAAVAILTLAPRPAVAAPELRGTP